jgi:cell division protein FtsN
MARDYKNAKRRPGGSSMSGIAGFVAGLALGLSVAMAVYLYDRRPAARVAQSAAPMTAEEDVDQEKKPASTPEDPDQQFEFYEMLPKQEVVVPEQEGASRGFRTSAPVEQPGAYILQAGSFRSSTDADRVRALIAMQGVESKIVPVTIQKDTWHRVRIGPITNLQKLEETRGKLRQVKIEPLVIPVGQ